MSSTVESFNIECPIQSQDGGIATILLKKILLYFEKNPNGIYEMKCPLGRQLMCIQSNGVRLSCNCSCNASGLIKI
jgi:hypothetical protein